jgi:hypothetical protein
MTRQDNGRLRMTLWIAAFLIMTLMAPPSRALNSETNRATLRGLAGVRVLIEDLPAEVLREGLTKTRLHADVELKLRKAGIKTLTQDECFKTPGEPYLYVNINLSLLKAESDHYAYSIDIGLIQNVTLLRAPEQATYAITWSTGGVGLIGKKQLSDLQDGIEDLLSIFVKAFLSVNPKQ